MAPPVSAMSLFLASVPIRSKVCVVGGTPLELEYLKAYEVTNHDYNTNGRRYESAPQRPEAYDGLYCSHTLEHMRNVGFTLDKMYSELKPNGLLCIIVPPLKHNIVGGHLSLWNAGLLLYNLIRARFDCRRAAVKTYGYNVAVLVRKARADYKDTDLKEDNGDIELLAPYFPLPVSQDFDVRIGECNWRAL